MTDLHLADLPPQMNQGVQYVEMGRLDEAWNIFLELAHADEDSPLVKSYMGLLRLLREKDAATGLSLCREALEADPGEALLHLNLAKAYAACGQRYAAIQTVRQGLRIRSPHRSMLVRLSAELGVRRKPVLRFLQRDHPLNKVLGMLTWKFSSARASTLRRTPWR